MRTVRGDTLDYDALLVAVGATPDMAIPGALTFSGPRDVGAFAALLADLDAGRVQRVAFALPTSVTWALPAVRAGADDRRARARARPARRRAHPRHAGARSARGLRRPHRIAHLGACWPSAASPCAPTRCRCAPDRADWSSPTARPSRPSGSSRCPGSVGPWIGGLPHDGQGFLATDAHGAVLGVEAVWAAGDGTAFPLKQGGLAAQQAGAAASAIARSLGADVPAEPFHPVLRGMLLDLAAPRFLDSTRGDVPTTPLWWPPTKVVAPRLWDYLAPGGSEGTADAEEIDVGDLLLALAERHAALGEDTLALRCLDAAVQVRGVLPPEAAARRDELAASHVATDARR